MNNLDLKESTFVCTLCESSLSIIDAAFKLADKAT